MATREVATDILIHGTAEQVWDALTDFDRYRRWNPFITKMRAQPEVGSPLRATAKLPVGVSMGFSGEITVVDPPHRIAWLAKPRFMPAGAFDIEHVITLSPREHDEVHLHQVEKVSGAMVRFSGWLLEQARAGQAKMNKALEDLVERM